MRNLNNVIKSGVAMLEVMEAWGVDHIYGIPGGSFNSIMNAFYDKQATIKYIQVRHEEAGAIAAAAESKLTGKIGVCFGTAGPGATHLFNGLYDAQMDRTPVLALIGQVVSGHMNYDYFQELNENPMFADVSVYNRTVMTPESLPDVVDEAIRRAYERKGVAVITIPVDYGYVDILKKEHYSNAESFRKPILLPDKKDLEKATEFIKGAERGVIYVGRGAYGATNEIMELSEKFSMPIISSVMAKGIIPEESENYMGTAGRVSTKPANEALEFCDLILFIGSDFPFAKYFFKEKTKFIQIDNDSSKLGKRHKADVAILSDAKLAIEELNKFNKKEKKSSKYLKACQENRKAWLKWMKDLQSNNDSPIKAEAIFREINRIAEDDAVFVTDVGNTTILAVRNLNMKGRHQFTTSGLFATMGYGVPGGIGAKLSMPEKQVFTLSGDGGFSMVMQEIATQVKYALPVINIVFSNNSLGFIEAEQEDMSQPVFGVDLIDIDFAKCAEAMGAKGYKITSTDQIETIFDEIRNTKQPVVVDIKISNDRPFPAEAMMLDEELYERHRINVFKKRYNVPDDMPILRELLEL